jgi:site-specific recombinase XerC
LRHNAATFLRAEFGLEVSRAILGHTSSATTLIYAEQDERHAVQAIAKVG